MILLILKTLGIAFVLTKFTPLQMILDIIFHSIKPKENKISLILNTLVNIITLLFTCLSCCSFWVGFLLGGIWIAIASYIIAFFYQARLSYLEIQKIKFPSIE